MGVPPSFEKAAQRRSDMPALVTFRSGRHGPSSAKHLTAQSHKIRDGVTGIGSDALKCWHDAAPWNQQESSLDLPLLRRCSLLLRFARETDESGHSQLRRPYCARMANTSAPDTAAHHPIEIANNHVRVIGWALRWRSQFAPEPARRFPRFHRIDERDHALMNMIASGASECPDVKAERAGRAGRDPCQHRHRFALRAWWSVERAHDEVPVHQAGAQDSRSPVDADSGR
jgi:hypothetical protein